MPPTRSPDDASFNYLPNYLQLAALLAEVSRLHSSRVILASEVGSAATYLRYDLGAAAPVLAEGSVTDRNIQQPVLTNN